MIKLSGIYKRAEGKWVSRFIMDEVVIMPLCRSQDDIQYIYSISNHTGSKLWQLLDGDHSVKEIQEIIKSVYNGQAEVIEREVLEFVRDIFEAKLIEEVKARETETKNSQCQIPQKKKAYKSPEIVKVKMQPEQAVLSCCTNPHLGKGNQYTNYCQTPSCSAPRACYSPSGNHHTFLSGSKS